MWARTRARSWIAPAWARRSRAPCFQVEKPTVGLLNIGAEEAKGLDEIKAAAAALKNPSLPIEYRGFIEGDDLGKGVVDVVVTEGFSGNIALKTAEGTAKQIGAYLTSRDEPVRDGAHRRASGSGRIPGACARKWTRAR